MSRPVYDLEKDHTQGKLRWLLKRAGTIVARPATKMQGRVIAAALGGTISKPKRTA